MVYTDARIRIRVLLQAYEKRDERKERFLLPLGLYVRRR
jgi:hypothetical protein